MNDNLVRASDLTSAQQTIKSLSTQLVEATSQLGEWKINLEAQVKVKGTEFVLELRFSKGNGEGYIDEISEADIEYYVEDPEALVNLIVNDVVNKLLHVHLRNHISPVITRGLRNAKMLKDRAS